MKNKTRLIVLVVVVALVVWAIYSIEGTKVKPGKIDSEGVGVSERGEELVVQEEVLKDGKYHKTPELAGISGYLNTKDEKIKIADFEGKVVLIDFWTYTCINCIRTLPFLTEWDRKYKDKGLVIIGVHTPEFEFEKDYNNVQDAMEKYNIEYAVVQDNDYVTWRAFENRYWPRKYLIDSEGFIRYDHIGEGGYEETELMIQELLAEIGEDVSDTETTEEGFNLRLITTPELYAGYGFALSRDQNIGNDGGLKVEQTFEYELPSEINENRIYLDGKWRSNQDNLELVEDEGSIVLDFSAKEVNIVADALINPMEMEVYIDGEYVNEEQAGNDVQFKSGRAFVLVDKPQLYNVFNGKYENYELRLVVKGSKYIFNAFTFG